MSKKYVGLDIGKKGFIAIQGDCNIEYYSLQENDMKDIFFYLKELKEDSNGNLF